MILLTLHLLTSDNICSFIMTLLLVIFYSIPMEIWKHIIASNELSNKSYTHNKRLIEKHFMIGVLSCSETRRLLENLWCHAKYNWITLGNLVLFL